MVVDGVYDVSSDPRLLAKPLTSVYGVCILVGTVIGSIAGISGIDGYSGMSLSVSSMMGLIFAVFIVGRIILGFGLAAYLITSQVMIQEVAHPRSRGKAAQAWVSVRSHASCPSDILEFVLYPGDRSGILGQLCVFLYVIWLVAMGELHFRLKLIASVLHISFKSPSPSPSSLALSLCRKLLDSTLARTSTIWHSSSLLNTTVMVIPRTSLSSSSTERYASPLKKSGKQKRRSGRRFLGIPVHVIV